MGSICPGTGGRGMKVHVSCAICGYSKTTTFMTRSVTGTSKSHRILHGKEKVPEVVICDHCLEMI